MSANDKRPYAQSGINTLKAAITKRSHRGKVRLLFQRQLDLRFPAAKELIAERDAWIADRGGTDGFSAKELTLLEAATKTNLYIAHLDHWLLAQTSLVNYKRRSVLPVLKERQALVDSLARLLSMLGLERKEKPVPNIQEYIREVEAKKAEGVKDQV